MFYFQFDDQPGGNPLPKVNRQNSQPPGTEEKTSEMANQSKEASQKYDGSERASKRLSETSSQAEVEKPSAEV